MATAPSVLACPKCGVEMVYANVKPKTFAQLAAFNCPACGHKSTVDDLMAQARAVIEKVTRGSK